MALLYFLLGILFAYIAIPCLEALVELIASWIEVKKIK
jgi:cytochrome c biogenesis protein CcdA